MFYKIFICKVFWQSVFIRPIKFICTNQESNSGHQTGNLVFCHLTIGALKLYFSSSKFRSSDPRVMGPMRFLCANSLILFINLININEASFEKRNKICAKRDSNPRIITIVGLKSTALDRSAIRAFVCFWYIHLIHLIHASLFCTERVSNPRIFTIVGLKSTALDHSAIRAFVCFSYKRLTLFSSTCYIYLKSKILFHK